MNHVAGQPFSRGLEVDRLCFCGAMSSRRYCSRRCENRAREQRRKTPCSVCAEPMTRNSRSLPIGEAVCRSCRVRRALRRPESVTSWACEGCGVLCSRPPTKGQTPKWCDECRKLRSTAVNIQLSRRLAIYERDGWVCQICLVPVDRSFIGTTSLQRPSLDHKLPRSFGGSDEDENLRLAHFLCNAVRSDGRNSDATVRSRVTA